jgi:surfactin synthase thioesterase subunit
MEHVAILPRVRFFLRYSVRCSTHKHITSRWFSTVQSEGPYYLLGLCIGSVVAWEIAQQLLVEGQEVGFLAMLGLPQQDSKAPGGFHAHWRYAN